MNNIKVEWEHAYKELSYRAELARDAMFVPFSFLKMYDQLSDKEKIEVQEILKEWALSDKSKFRWLATFIIQQRHIKSFAPTLKQSMKYVITLPSTPQLRDEIEELEKLIKELNA